MYLFSLQNRSTCLFIFLFDRSRLRGDLLLLVLDMLVDSYNITGVSFLMAFSLLNLESYKFAFTLLYMLYWYQ